MVDFLGHLVKGTRGLIHLYDKQYIVGTLTDMLDFHSRQ